MNHENISEDVHQRAIAAQKLVNNVVNHQTLYNHFVEDLRALGISLAEGDYVQQLNEHMQL